MGEAKPRQSGGTDGRISLMSSLPVDETARAHENRRHCSRPYFAPYLPGVNGTHQGFRPRIYVTKTENWETGTSTGNRKMKKWKQSRELEMNLVIGLKFQLGFFLILHFCRFACSFPPPCSLFIHIPLSPAIKEECEGF